MTAKTRYGAWEPSFASTYVGCWRLNYQGVGEWTLHYRMPGQAWEEKECGDVNTLSRWARTMGTPPRLESIPLHFDIHKTGSYEKRLFRLRDSLILIGWEQRCTTEGGIGTSFVSESEVTLYAEQGVQGGVDVWGRSTERFVGGTNFSIAEDCSSLEEIESAIENSGYSTALLNISQLNDLLKCSWTSL